LAFTFTPLSRSAFTAAVSPLLAAAKNSSLRSCAPATSEHINRRPGNAIRLVSIIHSAEERSVDCPSAHGFKLGSIQAFAQTAESTLPR
jgi:hypothetical protein